MFNFALQWSQEISFFWFDLSVELFITVYLFTLLTYRMSRNMSFAWKTIWHSVCRTFHMCRKNRLLLYTRLVIVINYLASLHRPALPCIIIQHHSTSRFLSSPVWYCIYLLVAQSSKSYVWMYHLVKQMSLLNVACQHEKMWRPLILWLVRFVFHFFLTEVEVGYWRFSICLAELVFDRKKYYSRKV